MTESSPSHRTQFLIALAIFLSVTTPLAWIWMSGGDLFYGKLFRIVAAPAYELFGLHDFSVRTRLHYANYIPFAALIAATPGVSLQKKLQWLLIGVPIVFGSHLFLNLSATQANRYQLSPAAKMIANGFPFLLWGVLCRNELASFGARALGRDGSCS